MLASKFKFSNNFNGKPSHKVATKATSSVAQTRNSSLSSALRIQKRKDAVKPIPDDFQAEYWLAPRERHGLDYYLNWSLNAVDITPKREAYRNIYLRSVIGHTNGNVDRKIKSVTVTTTPNDPDLVPFNEAFFKQAKVSLEESDHLYVHDGSVGTHKSAELVTRVITDDGNAALFLHHMFPILPLSTLGNPIEFITKRAEKLIVYYTPNFASPEYPNGYAMYDATNKFLLVGGNNNFSALLNLLASAATETIFCRPGNTIVPLAGDIADLKGNKVAVVNQGSSFLKKKIPVIGAHNFFFSNAGVSRAWSGISYPYVVGTPKKGDLIESLPNGNSFHTFSNYTPSLVQPSSLVFMIPDSQANLPAISKLSAQQTAQFVLAGYNGKSFGGYLNKVFPVDPKAVVNAVKTTVESTNVPVYIINTLAKGTEISTEEVSKLLESTADGSAEKAANKNLSALEKKIVEHLKTVYPDVTF